MDFIVTAKDIKINNNNTINQGEYNVSPCNFTFSEEYDGLVKVAVFSRGSKAFSESIENNTCIIPADILNKVGKLTIGVYAYEVTTQDDEEVLTKRYSPKPVGLRINEGSFIEDTETPEAPTPTEYEHFLQLLSEGLAQVQDINVSAVKEGHTTTITIIDKTGTTTQVQILDGEKGEKGDNTPVKGVDYWTEEDKTEIINDVLSEIQDSEEVYY